ncbi:cell division protein ZapA [Candidatus Palauibacter sp.]|uniref:cell division protein ZapA n=1 Tax=Candidatus Palauibacter sp. TaxID=3101350 RepID=UPI003B02BD06
MSSARGASPVRVMIFGEEYQIRTNRPESHTRACARYVDDAIQRAHVRGVVEPHRAAILAALQITDELIEERRDAEALAQAVEVRLVELAERLEALAGAGAAVEAPPGEAPEVAEADPA